MGKLRDSNSQLTWVFYTAPHHDSRSVKRVFWWLNARRSARERRQWDAKSKALIVLQGLKGTPVAQRCTAHQISQAHYSAWRDQLLRNASAAFEHQQQSHREARLVAGERPAQAHARGADARAQKKRRGARLSRTPLPRLAQLAVPLVARGQVLKAEPPCWGDRRW